MARATAAFVVVVVVLAGATTAHGSIPVTRYRLPPITRGDLRIGSSVGYAGPSATPSSSPPTDPGSVSSPPASDETPGPVGSGAGIIVLVAIGGVFLWLRARALRRR